MSIVDPATGAMWTLQPDDVSVTLKKQAASGPRDDGLTVALRADLPAELGPKLKPVDLAANAEIARQVRPIRGRIQTGG